MLKCLRRLAVVAAPFIAIQEINMRHHAPFAARSVVYFLIAGAVSGCASVKYETPGGPAQMSLFIERDIQAEFDRAGAASTPVYLTLARVQESGYHSYNYRAVGTGRFSAVTVREESEQEAIPRINALPKLAQAGWLNRLLLPQDLNSERDLRVAAASLHADMLLLYTFDTRFQTDDQSTPLTVVSLGFSPNQVVIVDTTVSAILLDVRTGYVYGTCEGNATQKKVASAWTNEDQVDRSRRATEAEAFGQMIGELERLWPSVVDRLPTKQAKAG